MGYQFAGSDTSASRGKVVTSGTSSGSLNSTWTELIASTSEESYWVTLTIRANSRPREAFRISLATGAAGSEVTIIEIPYWSCAIITASNSGNPGGQTITFPLTIASGTRVSANCACDASSHIIELTIALSGENKFGTCTTVFDSGFTSGFKGSATIDPGGTANTFGSWTEVDASTASDLTLLMVHVGPNDNISQSHSNNLIEIATGAAGAETAIVEGILWSHTATEMEGSAYFTYMLDIPSGTRISARSMCSITDATDRLIDVTILGFDWQPPSGGGGGGSAPGIVGLHSIDNQISA